MGLRYSYHTQFSYFILSRDYFDDFMQNCQINSLKRFAFLSWKMCESPKIFDRNVFIILLFMINEHWFKK